MLYIYINSLSVQCECTIFAKLIDIGCRVSRLASTNIESCIRNAQSRRHSLRTMADATTSSYDTLSSSMHIYATVRVDNMRDCRLVSMVDRCIYRLSSAACDRLCRRSMCTHQYATFEKVRTH